MGDRLLRVSDRDGRRIELGRELGRGGEGVVYDLPDQPDFVAKLYHAPPDASKQQKLRLRADAIDSPLREYAAWPEETLHDETGAVIGFTMQRIEKRLPIHMLYSPAQRRESFPTARFDFLVFVARNIAAAFETLHAHGHVLGDVNQGNVLVGDDSRVILIDCDSFQIEVGDALHRCEVGVAHFTPPELQSIASFEGITRTPNHDGFGLALLIFHLLMGGRHPYSGVPLAENVGESLEGDIRDFRYAYARDAQSRAIAPPPASIPIDSMPAAIVELFRRAFSETGVDARPRALDWVQALDALRTGLKACSTDIRHVHPGGARECVWCVMERRHVWLFGDAAPTEPDADRGSRLDVDAMELELAGLGLDEPMRMPELPLSPGAMQMQTDRWRPRVVAATMVAAIIFLLIERALSPRALGAMILVAVMMAFTGKLAGVFAAAEPSEYADARREFEKTRTRLRKLIKALNVANGSSAVSVWRAKVEALQRFEQEEAAALAEFKRTNPAAGRQTILRQGRGERRRKLERAVTEAFAKVRRAAPKKQSASEDLRYDVNELQRELRERHQRLVDLAARMP